MDFVTTSWNGSIDGQNIFVEQPLAYKVDINLVCKLLKALYRLKQLPRIWYQVLHNVLDRKEFTQTKTNYSIFVYLKRHLIIDMYVETCLLLEKIKKKLTSLNKL